ncbi:MAG TPA: TrmH family RNA methyltransferase [Acidobacteriota bacterium]|nr:TrmH family RNA methyltransferase [Acidobacteriota bacterium]
MDDNRRMSRRHITFILVRTQFASNLGTSVRAMKNMGFEKLVLIEPECEVGVEARARAMKGDTILDQARFYPSLQDAQREIPLLAGLTARYARGQRREDSRLRGFAHRLLPGLSEVPLGLVFGPEDNGLRREELNLCQYRVSIPGGSDFPVMNLSQAVAVVAYELHLALSGVEGDERAQPEEGAASAQEIGVLMKALEEKLGGRRLPHYWSRRRLMHRLRGLAARTALQSEDVNMLLSLLKEPDRERSE